jgi:Phytase/Secretion system C-terminal sorting domain
MKIKNSSIYNRYFTKVLSPLYFIVAFIFVFTGRSTLSQSLPECQLPQFGIISVDPDIEVNGLGQNIDTIEFWKAPDSTQTLMFVSAKGNQLVEVWKYPFEGNEQTPLTHSTFNGSQVNGLVIDQESDLLYVAIGEPSSTVSVFSLPDLTFQMNFNKPGVNYQSEPNLAILNLTNGNKSIYVSADFPVYIHNAVTGEFLSEFTPEKGLETMAGDDFYQRIYIPDENSRTGIYVYNPDGSPYTNNGSNQFGQGVFDADAEGIIVYNCPLNNPIDNGEGFIVVSDQRSSKTDFEFFDRITWEHLGTLNITGVSNTDGIASYPYPLPDYPLGVFAALNDDHAVAIVGWDKIFNKIFSATGIDDEKKTPQSFELFQNYPNPFNPSTKIRFSVPFVETGHAPSLQLVVYDDLGNEIITLVNEEKPEGSYEVNFDATELTSGVYFYQLKAGNFVQAKKMILLK